MISYAWERKLRWYILQVSLCVKHLVNTNDQGEVVKGVCSNFLCKHPFLNLSGITSLWKEVIFDNLILRSRKFWYWKYIFRFSFTLKQFHVTIFKFCNSTVQSSFENPTRFTLNLFKIKIYLLHKELMHLILIKNKLSCQYPGRYLYFHKNMLWCFGEKHSHLLGL